MHRIEQQIEDRIEAFVQELSALVKQAALQSVSRALSGPRGAAAGRAGSRARSGSNGRSVERKPSIVRRPGTRGPKRSVEALSEIQDALLEQIQLNPGQRMEQLGEALGMPTKDLDLLVKKLLSARQIKKRGRTRATTYHAV